MKRTKSIMATLAILLLFCGTGCGIGSYPPAPYYKNQLATLQYRGDANITAATLDQRNYVKSATDQLANYEGQYRNTFGDPSRQFTTTLSPLAPEMNKALAGSLKRQGFRVTSVVTEPAISSQRAKSALLGPKPRYAVLLRVSEWTYDGYNDFEQDYDLTLEVMDSAGEVLESANRKGKNKMGADFLKLRTLSKGNFKTLLGELLNDAKIVAALTGARAAPAAEKKEDAAEDAAGSPPPLPAPAAPAAKGSSRSATERLEELDKLLKKGLISRKDYDLKKKEILDSL